jgi:O-antigen ligase
VILFFVLDIIALYLTYSRGSLVGLAAGVLVVGVLRYRKLLLVGIAGVALLLLLPPAQAYVAHFIEGIQIQDRATLMRMGEYKDALALIARYPWFGVGFSGSPDSDLYVGVSNLYLLMAEEMGILGVVWFLVLMICFREPRRTWRRASTPDESLCKVQRRPWSWWELLCHYLFNLVYPHMSTLFWGFLGLGMSVTLVVDGRWQTRSRAQRVEKSE